MNVTILERSPGVFRLRVERRVKQDDGSTKRSFDYETIKGTREAAEQRRLDLLRADRDGGDESAQLGKSLTLKQYLTQWIERRQKARDISVPTAGWYLQMLTYVFDLIGDKKLAKVTPLEIEGVYHHLLSREKPLHPRTVRHIHTRLKTALNDAYLDGLIPSNPMARVRGPKVEEVTKTETLTPDDIRRLIECSYRYTGIGLIVRAALGTGMRRGELLALKWSDLSEDCRRIHVRRNLARMPDGTYMEKTPKTRASMRTITVPDALAEELYELRRRGAEDFSEYVFANMQGERRSPSGLANQVKELFREAGLERFSFHDLRHAHSTALLRSKMPLKAVSHRLGHANAVITLRTYSHAMPQDDEALADMMGNIMFMDAETHRKAAAPATEEKSDEPDHEDDEPDA